MKFSVPALALGLASSAAAQFSEFTNQTAPFYLKLSSSYAPYNNQYLSPAHSGAAIEVLSLTSQPVPRDAFYLNYTSQSGLNYGPSSGILTWVLQASGLNASSSVSIVPNLWSNVALPYIRPGPDGATLLQFDKDEKLFVSGGIDDRKIPLNVTVTTGPVYRWVVCQTYGGYIYTTLAWQLGEATAQNPSCKSVSVSREWLSK